MVGYWELTYEEIFESFVTGQPLTMGEPDTVDGPGCVACGGHWMSVRNEPCVPEQDEVEEV